MPPQNECDLKDACLKDKLKAVSFQATVMTKLDNIESGVADIKSGWDKSKGDLWDAIDDCRDDIKNIYFKVGAISGGTALLVTAIAFLIKAKLG